LIATRTTHTLKISKWACKRLIRTHLLSCNWIISWRLLKVIGCRRSYLRRIGALLNRIGRWGRTQVRAQWCTWRVLWIVRSKIVLSFLVASLDRILNSRGTQLRLGPYRVERICSGHQVPRLITKIFREALMSQACILPLTTVRGRYIPWRRTNMDSCKGFRIHYDLSLLLPIGLSSQDTRLAQGRSLLLLWGRKLRYYIRGSIMTRSMEYLRSGEA
jgi:hypothetical protein